MEFSAPTIVCIGGLPGTGKSTLADHLATRLKAPAFSGDWLLGALAPYRVLHDVERPRLLAPYENLLRTLAVRQLMLGQSAIVDGLVTDEIADRWRDEASRLGGRLLVVECVCGDEDVHRSRVDGRVRGIPGWHEIDWAHVERMRTEFPPLTTDRVVVDARHSLESNAALVLAALSA